MEKKVDAHVFTGMQRDIAISKHKAEYLYDAMNIRFTPVEGNTMLSITNERGPSYRAAYTGKYIGHCVIDKYLVLFTAETSICLILGEYKQELQEEYGQYYKEYRATADTDENIIASIGDVVNTGEPIHILRTEAQVIYLIDPRYPSRPISLFMGNLDLDLDYKLETIGVYESEDVVKVYWVDGKNQPRIINLLNVREPIGANTYSNINGYDPLVDFSFTDVNTQFDFIQTLALNEQVNVSKIQGGVFESGIIQYAFSYFYLNGQESNIFYITPWNYIGEPNTKSVSPDGTAFSAFKINLTGLETKFDYLRIYSIHRSSIDSVANCRIVTDLYIKDGDGTIEYVDTGDVGSTIDQAALYYIGGEFIIPNTLEQKDHTLFLANYYHKYLLLHDENITASYDFNVCTEEDPIDIEPRFKGGEHYYFGVQVQDKFGRWSDPYPLNVEQVPHDNFLYSVDCTVTGLPEDAIRARGVCMYPNKDQRRIMMSGVINPTVFRLSNSNEYKLFQSSWIFRPAFASDNLHPSYQFESNKSIFDYHYTDAINKDYWEIEGGTVGDSKSDFIISYDIVDLYSPDAELDNWDIPKSVLYKLYFTGELSFGYELTSIDNKISIDTDFTTVMQYTLGAPSEGVESVGKREIYKDFKLSNSFIYPEKENDSIVENTIKMFMFNSTGSQTTSRYSTEEKWNILKYNKYLRWGVAKTVPNPDGPQFLTDCFAKQYFAINGDSAVTFNQKDYYLGQVDDLIEVPSYPKYIWDSDTNKWVEAGADIAPNEKRLVEMQYKTGSHFVLSLTNHLYYITDNREVVTDDRTVVNARGFVRSKKEWLAHGTLDDLRFKVSEVFNNAVGLSQGSDPIWISGYGVNYDDAMGLIVNDVTLGNLITDGLYIVGWIQEDNVFGLYKVGVLYKEGPNNTKIIYQWYATRITGTDTRVKYRIRVGGSDKNLGWLEKFTSSGLDYFDDDGYTNPPTSDFFGTEYILENDVLIPYEAPSSPGDTWSSGVQIPIQSFGANYKLPLVDLVNTYPVEFNPDGIWMPASKNYSTVNGGTTNITFDIGDTWYQTYYCLKTYPMNLETTENQINDILEFKCPTRVNLYGRYSEISSVPHLPQIKSEGFNLVNSVYSNKNNFFTYNKVKDTEINEHLFKNALTWTEENTPNRDVDLWTNVTLVNDYRFEDPITKLIVNKENFFAFHPNAISKIGFNPRVQLSNSDSLPVELATTKKLYDTQLIIENVGTENKRAIIVTTEGIFFVDNLRKGLYLLSNQGEVACISTSKGFDRWFKDYNWMQSSLSYDFVKKDLYIINPETCLIFNSNLGEFTSFMSYGDVPAMFNMGEKYYCFNFSYKWLESKDSYVQKDTYVNLYEMFAGSYNRFFGIYQPTYMTFVSNPGGGTDKIFTNLEARLDIFKEPINGDGTWIDGATEKLFSPENLDYTKFFDYIRATNEYQDTGEVLLETSYFHPSKHGPDYNSKKKFRSWRIDIPRDKDRKLDRIRNNWAKIQIGLIPPVDPKVLSEDELYTYAENNGITDFSIAQYYEKIPGNALEGAYSARSQQAPALTPKQRATFEEYCRKHIILHDLDVLYFI